MPQHPLQHSLTLTQNLIIALVCWYTLASVATFAVYGIDKRKARLAKWRIKEQTLHLMELLGGWPGALIAQRYFHHKWKKMKFMLVFWAIVFIHIAGWVAVIYLQFQRRTQ